MASPMKIRQTLGGGEGKGALVCCSTRGRRESDATGDWTTTKSMNSAVTDSGERQGAQPHTHAHILPQTSLASRLPHNIEQNSTCYTVGPYW